MKDLKDKITQTGVTRLQKDTLKLKEKVISFMIT